MTERTIARYGLRGRRVRVYSLKTAHGTALVRVEWRESGKVQRESWPDTRETRRDAKGYAEGVAERLAQRGATAPSKLTLQELVHRYRLANEHWRPATLASRLYRLGKFLTFAGELRLADSVTPEMLDEFRSEMKRVARAKTGEPMVPTQINRCAAEVKGLFRFAKARRMIGENPFDGYIIRRGKDDRQEQREEYTIDEWGRILTQFSPRKSREWRAYCLMLLAGILGPRQNALRHLRWDDVDLHERTVTWRLHFDKVGRERVQPLPRDAVRAFRIARVWRGRMAYQGAWVFPAVSKRRQGKDAPYTYQALNYQLHEGERAAGVPVKKYRAMHGFRRGAAGNVLQLTGGSLKDAGDWIGDQDLRSLQKYLKTRGARQRDVAQLVSAPPTEQPTAESEVS